MTVTVHPSPGQSPSDLAAALLVYAERGDVLSATGVRRGFTVPREVAYRYLHATYGPPPALEPALVPEPLAPKRRRPRKPATASPSEEV